jgi:hypothetical protein
MDKKLIFTKLPYTYSWFIQRPFSNEHNIVCGDMMIIGYELWGMELIWNKNGMP